WDIGAMNALFAKGDGKGLIRRIPAPKGRGRVLVNAPADRSASTDSSSSPTARAESAMSWSATPGQSRPRNAHLATDVGSLLFPWQRRLDQKKPRRNPSSRKSSKIKKRIHGTHGC